MKQLSSFMLLNVNGGDRLSYTYDIIDEETGNPIKSNVKESMYVVMPELKEYIEAIKDYLRNNKLND